MKTTYYIKSVQKVHIKQYNRIIAEAWLYCGAYRCITGNHTRAASGAEVTQAYEDDLAQIMVSSDIEPEV